ncbi:E3 ubiquitin-protein ligase UHRF2 [Habropoda laboriosa]|uniref:E3 ubiquitin-protein ligase UHRF2 n=2 Tax=Habropoda laboriosa TaxID=597456 RepID=A0A0L7QV38_9HYME|nr:E3 ubiquitin-protein ligase UHRF2 [Habropoda laboriosa]
MAKNDGLMTYYANTTEENERMLHESYRKSQVEIKSKENFEQLFIKLNYICQVTSTKEETQLNSSWCNKNVINYIYGPISGFPSGSWWGIRMDCSRDRVHDPFDKNIQNGPFGVTSICTSSVNLNEDVDLGDFLTLTGQKYLDGKLDKDPLINNYENQIPVRLIRSYNLLNQFAPKTGYRYDGLYIVTNFWIGINSDSVKNYKFALLRLSDQDPPSWNIKQSPLSISTPISNLHSASTPSRNCLKNSVQNLYEFRKYSHSSEPIGQKRKHEKSNGFSPFPNFENKKVDEREKGTPESAIVTRHVFKKVNINTECTLNTPNISVMSENKSLTHIGNQGSKTHNTNISIRTGLYNSSHNTQHDNKKSTSSPFSRTAKSLNVLKINQHVENWNLPNKDKTKNLEGKAQIITSSEFPKRINYISFNMLKPESVKLKFAKDTNAEVNSSTNGTSSNSCYKHECNITHREVTNDSFDTSTNTLNLTNCMYKNETSIHTAVSKEIKELKSLDSLDSLTPDKILHLINNKDHPLSKLLMGNMIGLTSEQSIALNTEDSIITQSEVKDKIIIQNNSKDDIKAKTNFEAISDDLIGSRCYKFRRRRKLSRKIMNKSEMIRYNKIHNEKLKKGSAQPSGIVGQHLLSLNKCNDSQKNTQKIDICKDLENKTVKQNHVQTKSIKKNVVNKSETRMHLRAMRTINSSIKKHINKKQRREITNLLIDAKIGPKIRGPRYRRLRCINNTYAKQSYERFDSAMCMLNKCKINSERSGFKNRNKLAKITSCKRVKSKETANVKRSETLNIKQNKINRNLTVSKMIDKHHIARKFVNNNNDKAENNNSNYNNINSENDNKKKSKFIESSINIVDNKDAMNIKNRKRKLIQTVYTDPKYSKIEEKLQKSCGKEISNPCKTDAVTQCSLIKEPLKKNSKSNEIVSNEHYTFIKIEYGDFKDMKSEACETMKPNDENKKHSTSRSNGKYISCTETAYNIQHTKDATVSINSSILNTKQQNKLSPERMSAFVPVNILDNDVKIARLRSIGFKPINFSNNDEDINNHNKGNEVIKQNVAEKYNKYTNEENDIVVYMDDELQYQDIENEDKNSLSITCKASDSKVYTIKDERLNKMILETESYNSSLLEQDLESPWHGWKKVVTNKDTYWVGW